MTNTMTQDSKITNDLCRYVNAKKDAIKTQWIKTMQGRRLLVGASIEEARAAVDTMHDICVDHLKTGSLVSAGNYAATIAKTAAISGMTPSQIMMRFHVMRDYQVKALFEDYGNDRKKWADLMKVYEPAINRLLATVYDIFINERERSIERQQESLLESKEMYRILTERVADGIVLVQNGRFSFVNNAFVLMFGYTDPEQLLGKELRDIIADDFKEVFDKKYKGYEIGIYKENVFRGKCLTCDGRELWVETHPTVIKWKGEMAILATLSDITKVRLDEIAKNEEASYLREENIKLRTSIKERFRFGNIIGKSLAMQEIYELILKAGASDATAIIYGESGTGKELVARAIHKIGLRSDNSFVVVNSAAIPEQLLESEFFGHRKGSFTGANNDTSGYLDLAHNGTLFLDEVGELSLNIQAKLLRAIDVGEYASVGSTRVKKSNFRIIAATNRNLSEQVKQGAMREDFFFRLHVIPIRLVPLRDRKEDIPLLIDHFLSLHNNAGKTRILPGDVVEALYRYDWPGNVRELQNVLARYLIVGHVDFLNLSTKKFHGQNYAGANHGDDGAMELQPAVQRLEKEFIVNALHKNNWNRVKTATALGISRKTLLRKIKIYGMQRHDSRETKQGDLMNL